MTPDLSPAERERLPEDVRNLLDEAEWTISYYGDDREQLKYTCRAKTTIRIIAEWFRAREAVGKLEAEKADAVKELARSVGAHAIVMDVLATLRNGGYLPVWDSVERRIERFLAAAGTGEKTKTGKEKL